LLTGRGLGLIEQALGIGRDLAPATFVFEDIDLVAAERTMEFGGQGVLFELLNQMEGLAEDEDLLFVLTTNRPDLIEPALAARPGRVDLALEIPLPDAGGRRRLLGLYGAGIEIDAASADQLVERSDGVSGALIKELVRQAWLRAALEDREPPTAQDLRHVLDDLLEERSTLTRRLLGQRGDDTDGHPFPAMSHALHAAGAPDPSRRRNAIGDRAGRRLAVPQKDRPPRVLRRRFRQRRLGDVTARSARLGRQARPGTIPGQPCSSRARESIR
jgi:SpoVK/Ycf46/Vps4 family AAA+-type ATPase